MLEFIKIAGGVAGLIALIWRTLETVGAYIQMQVSVRQEELLSRVAIDTTVENKIHFGKRLKAAFLLIGPEHEDPEETARALKGSYPQIGDFKNLNKMVAQIAEGICCDEDRARIGIFDGDGRAIVPLTYYYWENINVGDERLSCSATVEKSKFPPGAYAVRFYVEAGAGRLFRSVQTVFQV